MSNADDHPYDDIKGDHALQATQLNASEYDQEMPQSLTTDQSMITHGRDTEH